MSLLLSVLDQSPIASGSTAAQALRNSVDLARLIDGLGYRRLWIAEHHATPGLASASPEALIGPIAASTSRIRVGSGGVMLPHYSPLKVAETFSALAGLFPDRIDLGLGRAPGTDPMTMYALQRDRRQASPDDFPEQLGELLAHLDGSLPADHPFARHAATLPGLPERPEVWLLGSSPQSAIWAGELGLRYAFADFINRDGAPIAALYRERFRPSADLSEPAVAVCAWAICAEDDESAHRLASSSQMTLRLLRRGRLIAVPPPEEALAFLARDGAGGPAGRGRSGERGEGRRGIIGAPSVVRAGIEELAESYGAAEVMVVTITHDHSARRRSYELIADVFGLTAASAQEAARAAA